jgi:hypothetical protein
MAVDVAAKAMVWRCTFMKWKAVRPLPDIGTEAVANCRFKRAIVKINY